MDVYQCEFQPLSDIADIIDCLHSKKPNSEKDSSYQLIQLDNIRDDGFLDMSACKYMISAEDYRNWTRKCEIREGDCVITNVGRIGAVSQAPAGVKAAMGRNMTCIRLKDDIKLNAYIITTLLSKHMKRQIESNTDEGTIMGALNVKNIPKLLLPIFVPTRMSELERLLFPIRKQIEYNNIQNQILSQTRDTLLPHLMSGEIDISNVEL
jgi:type I restriction enzyme S subunit